MDRSAIILAGGSSSRFGQDKALLSLANKPLIKHTLDVVESVVNEKIIVVSSTAQGHNLKKIVGSGVQVVMDVNGTQAPLIGAYTGFNNAHGRYSLLLPCDTPMAARQIIRHLLELCKSRDAVIPRWPNGHIEPLQAVYRTSSAIESAKKTLDKGRLDMRSMIDELQDVRYISTLVLQKLDPDLRTFFNINTPLDLEKAEYLLKSQNS